MAFTILEYSKYIPGAMFIGDADAGPCGAFYFVNCRDGDWYAHFIRATA